ncbi:MAG: hypothetical protein IT537_10120 [Hyphomicrobiales bacterium]|nr:hypothetical protein [Hyphomicrobiales bacterium]
MRDDAKASPEIAPRLRWSGPERTPGAEGQRSPTAAAKSSSAFLCQIEIIPGAGGVVASRTFDGDGSVIFGGQLGCNYQAVGSAFVVGIEGDAVGTSTDDQFHGEVFRFVAPATDHFNARGRFGTQSSVRLRVGSAWDRLPSSQNIDAGARHPLAQLLEGRHADCEEGQDRAPGTSATMMPIEKM